MSVVSPYPSVNEFINLLQTRQCNFYHPFTSNPPVVSIISSFFNGHQDFEATYCSIINQSWQNFEWIIVNDRSTHLDAIALFQSLSEKSPKIKTLTHQTNRGLAAGRNTAISQATGKYLFFMDLDDILEPTCIEKCVLFLETYPEFSFVNSYSVGFQAQEYWWTHGFNKPSQFLQQNWVTGRLLYRKVDFDKLGGFDEELRFYEDWERWLKAITNHQKGWTIPEYLDCYRRTNSGLLASSRVNVTEEKRVTELIQSRYQSFFINNLLPDISISRHIFNTTQIKLKIKVENPLKRPNDGRRLLCFFPHLEVGGADKFNIDLLTLLAQRDYDITIATTEKSQHPWHKHFYTLTPDIFHLPNFLDEYHWLPFIRYIIESRQIDIFFISNSYIAYYFLPILRAEFPNLAFVDYTHTPDPGWRGVGYPRISSQFSQFLDCQTVASHYLAELYQTINPQTKDKLRNCYINVDTNKWRLDTEKRCLKRSLLDIPNNTIVLLFPARIVEQKRPLFLVDIVKELIAQSLPIRVITLGNGYLLSELQAKVNQLGLGTIFHILQPVDSDEMLEFYAAADILLLPSEYEGISLSIYEAMSMELPVVASDVGGQSELVTPDTGFLVPKGQGDAAEVQEYVKVLIPLIQEQELRHKIGVQARQRVAKFFSLDTMANKMEAILTEALQLRQTQPQVEINSSLAEETLLLALEYVRLEPELGKQWREKTELNRKLADLWQEKCNLEQGLNTLWQDKSELEQKLASLWQEKCQLEEERHELQWKKQAMESSKFWKIRKIWIRFKRKLGWKGKEYV